jgi:hypothetical protein
MTFTLALAGDTTLGRGVAHRLRQSPRAPLLDRELIEIARSADAFLLNWSAVSLTVARGSTSRASRSSSARRRWRRSASPSSV